MRRINFTVTQQDWDLASIARAEGCENIESCALWQAISRIGIPVWRVGLHHARLKNERIIQITPHNRAIETAVKFDCWKEFPGERHFTLELPDDIELESREGQCQSKPTQTIIV